MITGMRRAGALPFVLCLCVSLSGCASSPKVYRDTWQPASLANAAGLPIVTKRALQVSHEDEQALRSAGAAFIGHHVGKSDWALRAGSTGGTHFVPVVEDESKTTTHCFVMGPGPFARCVGANRQQRWTKVAVMRVEPAFWHLLPPHLIPIDKTVPEGVHASAVRSGCTVERSKGTVTCRSSWAVTIDEKLAKQTLPEPTPAQAQAAESEPSQEATQQVAAPTTTPIPSTSL